MAIISAATTYAWFFSWGGNMGGAGTYYPVWASQGPTWSTSPGTWLTVTNTLSNGIVPGTISVWSNKDSLTTIACTQPANTVYKTDSECIANGSCKQYNEWDCASSSNSQSCGSISGNGCGRNQSGWNTWEMWGWLWGNAN